MSNLSGFFSTIFGGGDAKPSKDQKIQMKAATIQAQANQEALQSQISAVKAQGDKEVRDRITFEYEVAGFSAVVVFGILVFVAIRGKGKK